MKKRMLALTMAAAMVATTACSGGGKTTETTAAPAAAETTAAESKAETTEGSTEPVTLKIANYAVLEKGYEEFWTQVKNDYEAKYPNVTIEWVTAPYGEILNQVINMAGGGDRVDLIFS